MKVFTCSACQQTLFFENFQCTKCGHRLAYVPEHAVLTALEPQTPGSAPSASETFVALARPIKGERYRLCANSIQQNACNWAIPDADHAELCRACRLNEIIPNLSDPEAHREWLQLEASKRRLLYTLIELGLPVESRAERPEDGLAFSFLKEDPATGEKVFTGHSDGLITINVAEADAPFREKTRQELGETYRTLLGHFRHEIGHYYWDRLIEGSPFLPGFRELFGDETADYDQARQRHYDLGAPPDWTQHFVSSYASMHPWEDWAETWAHYLHMVDTLETARSFGLALRIKPSGGIPLPEVFTRRLDFDDFDDLMRAWVPLTAAVNNLNRSMGLPDLYPFVLPPLAVDKLRFVHDVVEKSGASTR
jgi:hypothetical protein